MEPRFNVDRPKISDEEINKQKNFKKLIEQFKQQSLQKAKLDKSWWKSKKVRYSTVIAGITVICTISYLAVINSQTKKSNANETLTTQKNYASTKNNKDQTLLADRGAFVRPPSQKLSVPYSTYKVSNQKGAEIVHNNLSKIKIPKNSFAYKDGRDVIGEVSIEYREFHEMGDIIAGGIPMAYDSAGTKYNLESAGMFDIKGSQNGQPVYIKPDKHIEVQLASRSAETRFNQYYLDTADMNWKYLRKDIPEKHLANKATENSPSITSNIKPEYTRKLNELRKEWEERLPARIDSVKTVYQKEIHSLPKVLEPAKPKKASGRQTFNIDASTDEFPELAAFSNLLFEIGDENKNYSREMNEVTWNNVAITEGPQKGKNYILTLSQRQRVEKLIVYPVLTGVDYDKAQKRYEQKFKEYEGLVERRIAGEKRLLAEMEAKQKAYQEDMARKKALYESERSRLLAGRQSQEINELNTVFSSLSTQVKASRIFSVSKFGIYNSDCPQSLPDGKTISPVFIITGNKPLILPDVLYLVNHDKQTVYNFSREMLNKITFDPLANNSFVVFVRNKMYLCNKQKFKESTIGDSNKFSVVELPESANNLADFKKALEI